MHHPLLFPDLDGLDGLIAESELFLQAYLWSLVVLVGLVVIGQCVSYFKRRSPVEQMLRRRFG